MKSRSFKSIVIADNNISNRKDIESALAADSEALAAANRLDFLLESSLDLFCGYAPTLSPHLPDNDLITLPWADEYFIELANSNRLYRRITHEEIERFASKLDAEVPDGEVKYLATFESKEPCSSPRFMVQGLAVEAFESPSFP